MRTGSIETTFAEFDFARLLRIHDVDFQFVIPSGTKELPRAPSMSVGLRSRADERLIYFGGRNSPARQSGFEVLTTSVRDRPLGDGKRTPSCPVFGSD
jgi:hypothetical protein